MNRIKYFYRTRSEILIGRKFYHKNSLIGLGIKKISINISPKYIVKNSLAINEIYNIIYLITNQKPIVTKAKKSISSFKIRSGMILGAKVSLRNDNMYNFLDKFFNIVMPRIKDFDGINDKSLKFRNITSIGIRENMVFPEVEGGIVDKIKGLNIVIVSNSRLQLFLRRLLKTLDMPLKN